MTTWPASWCSRGGCRRVWLPRLSEVEVSVSRCLVIGRGGLRQKCRRPPRSRKARCGAPRLLLADRADHLMRERFGRVPASARMLWTRSCEPASDSDMLLRMRERFGRFGRLARLVCSRILRCVSDAFAGFMRCECANGSVTLPWMCERIGHVPADLRTDRSRSPGCANRSVTFPWMCEPIGRL